MGVQPSRATPWPAGVGFGPGHSRPLALEASAVRVRKPARSNMVSVRKGKKEGRRREEGGKESEERSAGAGFMFTRNPSHSASQLAGWLADNHANAQQTNRPIHEEWVKSREKKDALGHALVRMRRGIAIIRGVPHHLRPCVIDR